MAIKGLVKGGNERLWCPDCGTLLTKPQFRDSSGAYHSYKCRHPMERVLVSVIGESEPF